jgi:alkanesulfonate monooxygenase SsuD/methylene tetrahydromethanopterin reductase-like flavin-dependent oxidoreductase (luciferase family)
MKLDLLYEFQPKIKPWAKPHPYGQRDAELRCYDEAIAEIQYADKLGFNTVWVVEHHFRDGRSASPCSEAILGGLALSTDQIKLGFGVTLMPFGFIHPARVAEKVATVDVLSHGRVEWGTGRSTPMEQAAFGVPTDDRSRAHWREAIEIVVGMWENETFSWNSENLVFPERMQTPKPFQDPHPPVWQAAASATSAVSAGELGLGLLSFALLQPVEKMAEHIQAYRTAQSLAREDMWPCATTGSASTPSCTATDADEAPTAACGVRQLVVRTSPSSRCGRSPMLSSGRTPSSLPPVIAGVPVQHYQNEDMIIIGTPEECLEKIIRYDEVGVDQLLCYVQFGDLPHEKVMRNLELLAKEVIPKLEARGHRINATAKL